MNAETLRQLIASCRRKSMRMLGFPREWTPERVKNPEMDGYYFTDVSAWELVADKLEAGHEFEEICLETPKGAWAIVMTIQLSASESLLYVKIQVGAANKAIGRSFHYSNYR